MVTRTADKNLEKEMAVVLGRIEAGKEAWVKVKNRVNKSRKIYCL